MKAAIITKPKELVVCEIERPRPGPDEVLVKVAYCGICATDYDIFSGNSSFVSQGKVVFPLRFGHEWSGVVCEVGSAVQSLAPGDKVAGDGKVTCNVCDDCMSGRINDCQHTISVGTVGNAWPGAMAEYMLMPARNTIKLQTDASLIEASAIEPAAIACNGYRETGIEGSTVLVIGTGAIGLAGVTIAKALGASKVISVGRKKSKIEIARKMGADVVINTSMEDIAEAVQHATFGKRAGIVLETTGDASVVQNIMSLVAFMGEVSLLSFYNHRLYDFNLDDIVLGRITFRGVSGSHGYFPIVANMIAKRQIDLRPLITHIVDFSEVSNAMQIYADAFETRVKLVVKIGDDDAGC